MPGGGGLEAAAAKPPRGAGVRAHVCAGEREPGRAAGARARSAAAHVTGTLRIGFHVTGGLRWRDAVSVV